MISLEMKPLYPKEEKMLSISRLMHKHLEDAINCNAFSCYGSCYLRKRR